MKKKAAEKQLPSTPDNAKHKSRQATKKSGDTARDNTPGQK